MGFSHPLFFCPSRVGVFIERQTQEALELSKKGGEVDAELRGRLAAIDKDHAEKRKEQNGLNTPQKGTL